MHNDPAYRLLLIGVLLLVGVSMTSSCHAFAPLTTATRSATSAAGSTRTLPLPQPRGGTKGSSVQSRNPTATILAAAAPKKESTTAKKTKTTATKKATSTKKVAAAKPAAEPIVVVEKASLEIMRKADLVNYVAEEAGMSKRATEDVVNLVLQGIQEGVNSGKKVSLPGFGIFAPKQRAARKGRNPQTGEEIQIGASITPGFTPSKTWKDTLNEK